MYKKIVMPLVLKLERGRYCWFDDSTIIDSWHTLHHSLMLTHNWLHSRYGILIELDRRQPHLPRHSWNLFLPPTHIIARRMNWVVLECSQAFALTASLLWQHYHHGFAVSPRLNTLQFDSCLHLTSLPHEMSSLATLEPLQASGCPPLDEICQKEIEDDQDWLKFVLRWRMVIVMNFILYLQEFIENVHWLLMVDTP